MVRRTRTTRNGISFSGRLVLMAGALLGKVGLLAIGVPTFGWAEGRNFFVKAGSGAEIGRYLEARPKEAEDVMLVLRYFDPVNFADMVSCLVLIGVGLNDDVFPAKTVYAIANHLQGPVEIIKFPVSHTQGPEEKRWEEFETVVLELGPVAATGRSTALPGKKPFALMRPPGHHATPTVDREIWTMKSQ
jgi:cephalosporin-C deacetylase